ncbi:MAG: hypothetical protein ACKV2T_10475 [Kofleriaceae bacterium]
MHVIVSVVLLVALLEDAHAGSWSFSWTCAGACAPGQLDARGVEDGFPDEDSCERARNEKRLEMNGQAGSAGSTTDCVDSDPSQPGSRGGVGGVVRAARLARAYFGVDGGRGYRATYDDGRDERGASQVGGQLELVFGRDVFGLAIEAGLRRDAGTSPMAGLAADPMTLLDLGFGLASSPFALYSGPRIEVRPDLGAFYVWAIRLGCDRCTVDVVNPVPVEPSSGNTFRVRGGLDIYVGAKKQHGIALDVIYQLGTLGDVEAGADEPTSMELRPPRFLFRLSYVRRPRN